MCPHADPVDQVTMEQVGYVLYAYTHAVEKHPDFVDSPEKAICIMSEELGELAQAVNNGDLVHAEEEAAQLAAVCIRFLEHLSSN